MSRTMHIRTLIIDGAEPDGVLHGVVLLPGGATAWQIHAATTRRIDWKVGSEYAVRIVTREGPTLEGRVGLRRSDGKAHYFVGQNEPAELAER